ncbi:hypothetical protein BBO99_00008883 [Phytophthora kernoviae]|uniref:Uncharacterized protein n=2 Tax=Phytophthora kernoviae TaxID=325452 RepID=A0A421GDY5_9STRA|nr:hypothetical protein G195_010383 [Phytophthora kernoviae 00238/432]KAG2509840.1 hypothetical protein JM16_008611 [Phytophthora kernoviae]KAG2509976.1 hypothetical protein JM18_008727 [Phytophthora kernoviae]RLN36686.1 hypothetical protein BBI17_008901 [Phytophthora kernoviae]RLN74549.1 hypothetical protein BBO99_00008883 [Phytophthora kernoviae]
MQRHRTQVEKSIRQEDKKLKYVEVRELFQLNSKGDDVDPVVTKKQKLEKLQKDPILASTHKFDSKLNKDGVLAVKKLQQQPQTPEQSVKPKKSKKIQNRWG